MTQKPCRSTHMVERAAPFACTIGEKRFADELDFKEAPGADNGRVDGMLV